MFAFGGDAVTFFPFFSCPNSRYFCNNWQRGFRGTLGSVLWLLLALHSGITLAVFRRHYGVPEV